MGGTCALYGPNPIESGAVSTAPALVRSTHIAQEPISSSGDKDKDKVESKNFLHIVQLEVHSKESAVQGLSQSLSRGVSVGNSVEQRSEQAVVQEKVRGVGAAFAVSGVVAAQSGISISGDSSAGGSSGSREPQVANSNRAEPRSGRESGGQKVSMQVAPSCLHVGSGERGSDHELCSHKMEIVDVLSVGNNNQNMNMNMMTHGPNRSHDSALSSNRVAGSSIDFTDNTVENALDDWSSIWT